MQQTQRDLRAVMVSGFTIYPARVVTQDLEVATPIGAASIAAGTLAALSTTLGAVTVDADLALSSTATTRTIYFRTASTNYIALGTNALSLVVGTTGSDTLALKRGSTTVMSFVGNANTVTFAGDLDINGTGTTNCDGDVQLATGKAFKGDHQSFAGTQRADGTFTFYASATSGGAVTQKHDITFSDGLITGWVVT